MAGRPAVGAEVGTFKGESAEWMCDNIFTHPESLYFCIDPFTGAIDHHVNGIDCSTLEQESRERLARFSQVRIIKGCSNTVLRGMEGDYLDFLYVDGAHDAQNVLRDAVLGFELLRVGGVMVFDDYRWTVMPDDLDRPAMAIDAFITCYARQLEVIGTGWQVAIRKNA